MGAYRFLSRALITRNGRILGLRSMQNEAQRRGPSLIDTIIRDVQRIVYCLRMAFPVTFMPKTIVDLGANIGMASVYYANQYPEAKIVAVEAEASNFAALCRNVRSYRNTLPVHAAVWSGDGLVTMTTPEGTDAGIDTLTFAVREGDGTQVRSVTMTTLMRETGISSIDLLKVDIEGAEKEVFEAASDWIHGIGCIAIELHDRFKPGCASALRSVTGDFLESQRGETTFYIRKSSCLSPPEERVAS